MPYIMTESGFESDAEEKRIMAKEERMLYYGKYVSLVGLLVLIVILKAAGFF
jgi:hypothetical protein